MNRLHQSYAVYACSLVAAAGGVAAFAALLLKGRSAELATLPLPSMGPFTAAGFVVAAFGLWRLPREERVSQPNRVFQICSFATVLLGAIQLAFCMLGQAVAGQIEMLGGAVTWPAAIMLLLVGAALVSVDSEISLGLWWGECLALLVAVISIFPLVAFGYSGATGISASAAFILLALATGIIVARPSRGLAAVISSDALGGMIARRLVPAAILIPWTLGWLRLLGQRWQLYGTEMGSALLVASTIVLFCGVAIWMAGLLNRLDQERENANESLRQRNEEIYDLYSRAPCGYHSLDADGVFQAINDTELEWIGYERDEVVGKMRFADFLSLETRGVFEANFLAFKQRGSVTGLEFSLRCRDGRELPVMLNATAVYDSGGRYLTSRSTLFDATELKRAEEKGRELHAELEKRVSERTAELARSNAELMQKNQENAMFVYGVSHDLRSPLVNLEGFSSELSMVCDELRELITTTNVPEGFQNRSLALIDQDMRQSVRFIQTAVQRLSSIIDALLRLSRAGRVEYQWQEVNLAETVSRIVEAMAGSIDERAAVVTVGYLPAVFGDPTAVEQVFANLIGNAVNYLAPGRPGRVDVGSIPAEQNAAGGAGLSLQTFYVKDNGRGIPEAYSDKVFQALKRLHPEAAKGEGIGLALVRRIVERHGGSVWFTSKEGRGTEFYFTLPIQSAEAREKSSPPFPMPLPADEETINRLAMHGTASCAF